MKLDDLRDKAIVGIDSIPTSGTPTNIEIKIPPGSTGSNLIFANETDKCDYPGCENHFFKSDFAGNWCLEHIKKCEDIGCLERVKPLIRFCQRCRDHRSRNPNKRRR